MGDRRGPIGDMIRWMTYGVAAVAAVALWLWMRSDTVRVRRTFDEVAKLIERESTESVMENAVKCRALAGYVAKACRVEIPEHQVNGTVSPEDFSGGMLAFRNEVKRIRVAFSDLKVSVKAGRATVVGQVDFTGSDAGIGIQEPLVRGFEATLVENASGRWQFSVMRIVRGS